MRVLRGDGGVDAGDRGGDRGGVESETLNDGGSGLVGRIVDGLLIEYCAADLLRGIRVGQRHCDLVVDRLQVLLDGQELRRRQTGEGQTIDIDQVMEGMQSNGCSIKPA